MRKFIISFFIISGMLSNTVVAFAEEVKETARDCSQAENQVTCRIQQGVTEQTTVPQGTVSNLPMSGNTVTTYGNTGAAGTGAYTQAAAAKDQANNTMLIAMAMAAMFFSQCNPPHNVTPCVLGAAAAAAAMMAAGKKSEANKLMNQLGNNSQTTTTDTTTDATNNAQLNNIRDQLRSKGYKLNSDGSFTAPNGALVDSGLSEQSLASAGLNNSEISGVKSQLDKMKKEMQDKLAKASTENTASGMGDSAMSGAYGGGGKKNGSTSEAGKGDPNAGQLVGLDRNPAAWDGFYKQYGDSLIGVGQNDIFMMVQKRVEKERKDMGH